MYIYIGIGVIVATICAYRKQAQASMDEEQNQPSPDIAENEPPVTDIRHNPVTDFDPLAIDPMPQPKRKGRKK
jgi:hypothetical protein